MGEDGGPEEVVVAVDSVGAVDDGDAKTRGNGPALHLVNHVGPISSRCLLSRGTAAGAEDAANGETVERVGSGYGSLDLGHLGGLFPQ